MLIARERWDWRGLIPEEVTTVQLMRPLKSGEGRLYEAMIFKDGAKDIGVFLTQLMFKGDTEGAYAMLDLLADNGDLIEEIGIPDAEQFRRIKRKLGCKVVDVEAEVAKYRARQDVHTRDSVGPAKDVAREFGVSASMVYDIRNGKLWKEQS